MACFVVPAAEAVVTTIAAKVLRTHEKEETIQIRHADGSVEEAIKLPFSEKLGWLNKLLWGGSALLAFEHVWHGEVIPTFPFLTAVQTGDTADMLAEMGSAGVLMAVIVTAVWGGMVALSAAAEKQAAPVEAAEPAAGGANA